MNSIGTTLSPTSQASLIDPSEQIYLSWFDSPNCPEELSKKKRRGGHCHIFKQILRSNLQNRTFDKKAYLPARKIV